MQHILIPRTFAVEFHSTAKMLNRIIAIEFHSTVKMLSLGTMVDKLNRHNEETPQKILAGINNGINEFVADAPQFDDITMLCLELKEDEVRNGGTPEEEAL